MVSRCCVFLFALLLAATGAAAAPPPQKFALLVGIADYHGPGAPAVPRAEQWSPLGGSLNDVAALRAELVRRGFDVLVLTDAQATHRGIVEAFRRQLIDRVLPGRGDVVLFHFSGHGQQVPDDNGEPDEADGYDETLVPFDSRGTLDYSHHLRDDELGALVAELARKTPNIVVSLDSCHSGTATRGRVARGGPPTHPPSLRRGAEVDAGSGLGQGAAEHAGYVLLSATRAEQQAFEVVDRATQKSMGAFSYLLVQALAEAGPKTSYQQLLDRIGILMNEVSPGQEPQIEGDADKRLFSGVWGAPESSFRVRPVTPEGLVPVEAGVLHGLSQGVVLAIFLSTGSSTGPSTGQSGGPLDPRLVLGRIRLVRVELGVAYGQPLAGARFDSRQLVHGARAVIAEVSDSPDRLRVALPGGGAGRERALAAMGQGRELPFVELVDDAALADVRGEVVDGRLRLVRARGSIVAFPMGPGLPMVADLALSEGASAARLAAALEIEYRRRRLVRLGNRDPRTRLDVGFSLSRVRVEQETLAGGRRRARIVETLGSVRKDGSDGLRIGEAIQFQVENHTEAPVFFSLFEFTADGGIGLLYPDRRAGRVDNRLEPGEVRWVEVPYRMTPPAGTELFKLIATERDIDLSSLVYVPGVPGVPGVSGGTERSAASPLARVLGELCRTRGEPVSYAIEERWGTDAARIELR